MYARNSCSKAYTHRTRHTYTYVPYMDECICGNKNGFLTFDYACWQYALFLSIVDDQPEHIYLNRHVRNKLCEACDVNPQAWKDLGTELMPDAVAELSTISAQHHGSVVDCCSSLFQLWLQKQPDASWRQLIEALKKISLNRLATEIERKLIYSVDSASQSVVPRRPIEGT